MSRPIPFPMNASGLPSSGSVLEFLRLLWAIDQALQQRSKRMAKELGVTGVQRFVIRVVGKYPSITPGQLAGILHLHPSTVTGVIQRLQRRGFLFRRIDPSDKRRSRLALTQQGRAIYARRGGTVESEVEKALETLHPDDIATALRVLTTIGDQLAP